jgi:hypothetical protein
MDVARLNFSHGDYDRHRRVIGNIRSAAKAAGRRVAILGDLPGPKIRIGKLEREPVDLNAGDEFTLTTESDTMPLGGFGYPLGLGLGYLGVGVNGGLGMTNGGIGMPFYYGH